MRVRPDHRGHPSVQPARHRHLLARRLGMEVHDHDRRLRVRVGDQGVDHLERLRCDPHEQAPQQVDHGDGYAVARRRCREPSPGSVCGQVGGPDDAVRFRQVGNDLAPPPDVVSERDHVGARRQQALGDLRGESGAVGGVLPVHDAEVDIQFLAQGRQPFLDGAAAGRAEDIRNEEEIQGMERVALRRNSIVTWLPASCV
jgi:hypothetical protein